MKEDIKEIHIITYYMNYVLKHGEAPKNAYIFANENGFEESDFYKHFASFEALEKEIFNLFYNHTIEMLHKNDSYQEFEAKDKLLSFYYTFIEILTANRSYVLHVLREQNNPLKNMSLLSGLRKNVKAFIKDLEIEKLDLTNKTLNNIRDKNIEEFGWGQLVLFINFWIKDTSPSFEKTDLLIEKSVTASFDLIDIKPVKSILDLGKFLIKENLNI